MNVEKGFRRLAHVVGGGFALYAFALTWEDAEVWGVLLALLFGYIIGSLSVRALFSLVRWVVQGFREP